MNNVVEKFKNGRKISQNGPPGIRKMQTAAGGPLFPWLKQDTEWVNEWKFRTTPASRSKVVGGWTSKGKMKKVETAKEYTQRRIRETAPQRTWLSDAADIAHGVREAALAIHPLTAIPYFGAKVGLDFLNGNVGWHTALNASVPLFHMAPQAVGLREATNVALEDAANAGSKTARNWRVAREIKLATKNRPKYTRVPSKNLFRTQVYKGGEVTDPYSNFVTTDPLYAANYGKVTPYIFESKSVAKAKEPMMGSSDPVNMDMFIYYNTKHNPNATAIIGHDAVTGEFQPSKGVEILNMNPKNLYPVRTSDSPTSLKFFERKPSKISEAERIGVPKGERFKNNKSLKGFNYNDLPTEKYTYNNKTGDWDISAPKKEWVLKGENDLVPDYFISPEEQQRLVASGLSPEEAAEIMQTRFTNSINARPGIFRNLGKNVYGESRVSEGYAQPVYNNRKGVKTSLNDAKTTLNTVFHELGGHGSSLNGELSSFKLDNPLVKIMIHNEGLRPLLKPFYLAVKNGDFKLAEKLAPKDGSLKGAAGTYDFKELLKFIKYMEENLEYSARAIGTNMSNHYGMPNGWNEQLLREYFTKESVDNLLKNVWNYGVPVTTGGYTLYNLFNQPLQQLQYLKQGGKINTLLKFKNGGLIRKMLTAAGGPLRIKFDPERIARLEYLMTRVPGMNNSGGNRYRKEGILALQHLELEAKRKEEEIKSRMEMRPTLKRKATKAEKLQGKKDEYEQVPLVVGMSGTDPVGEFILAGIGLNGVGTLAKTGLWNVAKYAPATQLGNWGRGYFVGNTFKNSFNGAVPTLTSQATSLLYLPVKLNESGLTSLNFFKRKPARINEAEKAGIPKGDRNNKKIINPDNVYGNLRFIRNIDGLPTVKDGLVQLGNSDKLLTNFTTDLPFRLHDWYSNIPGSTYMVVSPRAFKGKKFYSIKPSDSFLSTVDSKVTPNQVRIISGDPKILEEAERRGMRTLTSDKLQDLFNVGSEITKKEFELGRNGAVRPFANADVAINDFKFRNRFYGEDVPEILSKYPEGVVTPYRAEIDKLISQNIGRPSVKDYLTLENMTGLDSGITNKFDSELIKKAKDPLATRDMFEKVYYPVTSQIEEELMNSIGLYPGPYYSFSNLLKLNKLKGNPIKKKQGGKMNILEFLKNGSGIHIKEKNKGKFTSYCGGKVTDECILKGKNSSNPAIRKRATFAANARKWKHKNGGILYIFLEGGKTKNSFWKNAGNFLVNSGLGNALIEGGLGLLLSSSQNKSIAGSADIAKSEIDKEEQEAKQLAMLKAKLDALNMLLFDPNNPNAFGGNIFLNYILLLLYNEHLDYIKKNANNRKKLIDMLSLQMQGENTSNAFSNILGLGANALMNYLGNKVSNKTTTPNN